MRPPRHGAANCERGQSFATAPALRRVLNLLKGKDCHVTLRCNFSNYCDHSRNIGLWRNRGNVCVDRPCPVRYISRAVSDFADIQGKAICLARHQCRGGGSAGCAKRPRSCGTAILLKVRPIHPHALSMLPFGFFIGACILNWCENLVSSGSAVPLCRILAKPPTD
jgi:hypothetical protein